MEKKQILIGSVMTGVGLWFIPGIFGDSAIITGIFKAVAMIAIGFGVIYFIAGDILFSKSARKGKYGKAVNKMLKDGKITPEQAFDEQKKIFARELEFAKQQLLIEEQNELIAKKKAEIKKHKAGPVKVAVPGEKKSLMPDILGNIGPMMANTKQDNLSDIMGTSKQKKQQDDLKNLF